MPNPFIEFDDYGHARIVVDDHVVAELTDGADSAIAKIWQHMRVDHSEESARIYLTGVCHGIRENAVKHMLRAIERSKAMKDGDARLISGL